MPSVRVDLSEEDDALISIYKAANGIGSKEETILAIIRAFEPARKLMANVKRASK